MKQQAPSPLHGVLAAFRTPKELLAAIHRAKEAGYSQMDAYTPYPIESVYEALGHHHSKVPLITLAGSLLGAAGGFGLPYWISVVDYPLNVGGRPFFSWPAWIPVTFECAILLGGLSAMVGMFLVNGLPRPYHPVFNVPSFSAASRDRYFLCIEAGDAKFDARAARELLASLNPLEVSDVES